MSGDDLALPGTPGKVLQALWGKLSPREQGALRKHVLGGTPAEWIERTLRSHGHTVSASSIRTYRRSLRQTGA